MSTPYVFPLRAEQNAGRQHEEKRRRSAKADSKGIDGQGLASPGPPQGRRTGTKPGERSIPQAWRDLDNGCLEFALNEMNDESWDDEQFVSCAARRARFHERHGDYKVIKLAVSRPGRVNLERTNSE